MEASAGVGTKPQHGQVAGTDSTIFSQPPTPPVKLTEFECTQWSFTRGAQRRIGSRKLRRKFAGSNGYWALQSPLQGLMQVRNVIFISGGPFLGAVQLTCMHHIERIKLRMSIETQLQATVLNIITTASMKKDHIPPITTNEANPFPYSIIVSPKGETWGARMGIFSN